MSSQQFQSTYESVHYTGTRLLQYLRELRLGQLGEGDDTKRLQTVEDDITEALNALKEQKYQVAVIAAMKAGKSTFLNSLIGSDVLASERESCTVCRTDVRPIAAGQTPRLLEYREGQTTPVPLAEGKAEVIQQKFLERTREIRDPRNSNSDKTIRFELEHPIEAISNLSSLAGFTLVDTPGPNEWESAGFNTAALKRTALEALRTCDAILFILDYTSFRDDTNSELLKELEQRREVLAENTGKIYFILNKVDQKAERDRPISAVIEDLRELLIGFGIPKPIIYPAIAWQGLLAKLLQKGVATKEHKNDFKNFFLARYIEEDKNGEIHIPKFTEIAPQVLQDSGIPTIEQSVIQTVVQNSGWNLLSDVLAKIDKAAKAIEDNLNIRVSGWTMEIETLRGKVEEYRKRAEAAKKKVEAVKQSVEEQKQILTKGFSRGLSIFADGAKAKIQGEIDRVAESRSFTNFKLEISGKSDNSLGNFIGGIGEISSTLLEVILGRLGKGLGAIITESLSLLPDLMRTNSEYFSGSDNNESKTHDPYIIRCKTKDEAENIIKAINNYCAPHVESWWIDTQDELIKGRTRVREELVQRIQHDIQQISNELSVFLGDALQVELNISPIQFPGFDFPGIDAQIQHQQERVKVIERGFCKSEKIYYVPLSTYEVNLHQAGEAIKQKIDEQVVSSQQLLQLVIKNQVKEDFKSAEKQISDYIDRFQTEFDCLLRERETREVEADQIRAMLESQKPQLNEYLSKLISIRESLDSWKPAQSVMHIAPLVPPQHSRKVVSATNSLAGRL